MVLNVLCLSSLNYWQHHSFKLIFIVFENGAKKICSIQSNLNVIHFEFFNRLAAYIYSEFHHYNFHKHFQIFIEQKNQRTFNLQPKNDSQEKIGSKT